MCWQWYYAAFPLIYAHCRLSSIPSLQLLCRTLKPSKGLSPRVRTLSFSRIYSLTGDAHWENDSYDEGRLLEKALVRLFTVLPRTTEISIEISAYRLPWLAKSVAANSSLLTSLCIGAVGFTTRSFDDGMCFPHLRSLTIEINIIIGPTTWPSMPQLRSLRIKNMTTVLHNQNTGILGSFPSLIRVELLRTFFRSSNNNDLLTPGELQPGIQDLVIFDSFLPSLVCFPSPSMGHCESLRTLTLALGKWPMLAQSVSILLNLEVLTMMQLTQDFVKYSSQQYNTDSMFDTLIQLLGDAHYTPSLQTVRVACRRDVWNNENSNKLQEIAKARSLHLELVIMVNALFIRIVSITSIKADVPRELLPMPQGSSET